MTAVSTRFLAEPDVLERRVLIAVELIDPITQAIVSQGVTVTASGLSRPPIVSLSGRFVWLLEGDAWPDAIAIEPAGGPFARQQQPVPPPAADVRTLAPARRLMRIVMQPTAAYPFDTGMTTLRGCLRESLDPGATPVAGARVQLAWFKDSPIAMEPDEWIPPPPAPGDALATDARGEFVAFLQPAPSQPDVDHGLIRVRLQFTRGLDTRVTPDSFQFLPPPAPPSRVPEGQLLLRDVRVGWAELVGI